MTAAPKPKRHRKPRPVMTLADIGLLYYEPGHALPIRIRSATIVDGLHFMLRVTGRISAESTRGTPSATDFHLFVADGGPQVTVRRERAARTTTPENTLAAAGVSDARQADYQRKMSTLLAAPAPEATP